MAYDEECKGCGKLKEDCEATDYYVNGRWIVCQATEDDEAADRGDWEYHQGAGQ